MMSREGKFTSSAPPLSEISVERPFPTAAQQARGEAEHSGPTKLRRQKSKLGAAEEPEVCGAEHQTEGSLAVGEAQSWETVP